MPHTLLILHFRYIDSDPEQFNTALLPPHVLNALEADSFWCLSRMLDGIQDNYIATQPGIHRSVKRMSELVARIDRNEFFSMPHGVVLTVLSFSASGSTSRFGKRGIYAICVQMDELFADAGDQRAEYHPDVGYLSGEPHIRVEQTSSLMKSILGRRTRCIFPIPLICLFSVSSQVEQEITRNGHHPS